MNTDSLVSSNRGSNWVYGFISRRFIQSTIYSKKRKRLLHCLGSNVFGPEIQQLRTVSKRKLLNFLFVLNTSRTNRCAIKARWPRRLLWARQVRDVIDQLHPFRRSRCQTRLVRFGDELLFVAFHQRYVFILPLCLLVDVWDCTFYTTELPLWGDASTEFVI